MGVFSGMEWHSAGNRLRSRWDDLFAVESSCMGLLLCERRKNSVGINKREIMNNVCYMIILKLGSH